MLKPPENKPVIGKDRRQSRRCRSFGLLKYCVLNRSSRNTTLINPRDISANGVAFVSESSLPVQTILEIDMYLPPLSGFITVIARVVRTAKIKDSGQYLIGAHFTAMDPADKARINDYINRLADDPSKQQYFDKQVKHFRR